MTALMFSAQGGHTQCVDLLIKAGSDVTAKGGMVRGGVEGVGGWAWERGAALLGGNG